MKSAWVYDDRLSVNSDLGRQITFMEESFSIKRNISSSLLLGDLLSLLLPLPLFLLFSAFALKLS